jgi:hypothetical protein
MGAIEQAREMVARARPTHDEPTVADNMAPEQPRVVIDVEDIATIASRHRLHGHREGYQRGAADAAQFEARRRERAINEAETRGVIAGLRVALEEIGDAEDGALGTLREAVEATLLGITQEGLHGERRTGVFGQAVER